MESEQEKQCRAKIETEMVSWLIGIRDHTDNDAEHDLLSSLIDSIENQEYIEAPIVPSDRVAGPLSANCPF